MIEIKVLGTGCPSCRMLELMVEKTVKKLGIDAEIEHVPNIDKILEYGILMTPALVINGEVKVNGRLPSEKQLIKYIPIECILLSALYFKTNLLVNMYCILIFSNNI